MRSCLQKALIRSFVVIAAVTTAGCETALTFEQLRHSRGAGSREAYDAGVDTVWNAVPGAVEKAGLAVAGDNRQEGYVLAEKTVWTVTEVVLGSDRKTAMVEKAVVFVERLDRRTMVEVIAARSMSSNRLHGPSPPAATSRDLERSILDGLGQLLHTRATGSRTD